MSKTCNPVKGLIAAWNLLLDYPCPLPSLKFGAATQIETGVGIPLLGWIFGMIIWFISSTIATVFNSVAGSAVFVILAMTMLEFKDFGRGIKLITTMILQMVNSPYAPMSQGEFFLTPLPTAIWFLLLIIKGLMLLALGLYGGMGWLGAVVCAAFAMQGLLACSGDKPLLVSSKEVAKGIRWSLGIIGFIYLCWYPLAAILASVLFWFIYREQCRKNLEFNPKTISLIGAFSEWVWLATGLLVAIKLG